MFIFCWTTIEFEYTGDVQTFTSFCPGSYRIELWGADGGRMLLQGVYYNEHGYGAYTSGEIYLNAHVSLYVYVGGKGNDAIVGQAVPGGYNGGGTGHWDEFDDEAAGSGGGATDIRLVKGEWNDFESLKSRIMVAAGAGGVGFNSTAGSGGGLEADMLFNTTYGGTQTNGYAFGYGQDAVEVIDDVTGTYGSGGGGGGYYGGKVTYSIGKANGTGGSSYISGHNGCSSITKDSTKDKITHTLSEHYSGFVFTNTKIIDGNGYNWTTKKEEKIERPTYADNSKSGNGYAVITYLGNTGTEQKTCYEGETVKISYSGTNISFNTPCDGNYQIELWGASGGYSLVNNALGKKVALGAYTSGNINLAKNKQFYVYVGGKGENGVYQARASGGYNGGGSADWDHTDDEASGGGGGATDVRLVDGEWNNFESLKSRIMVAAGAGGDSYNLGGGAGGGLYAQTLFNAVLGATQKSGNAFGYGEDGYDNGATGSLGVAGGGGGYYGGLSKDQYYQSSGTGGSSFISGHNGCDAILEESTQEKIVHSGQPNHYSKYIFTNTKIIDGDGYEWVGLERGTRTQMPNVDGTGVMYGNTGDGVARITYLGK